MNPRAHPTLARLEVTVRQKLPRKKLTTWFQAVIPKAVKHPPVGVLFSGQHRCPELTRPGINVLKNMLVNGIWAVSKRPANGLSCSSRFGTGVQGFKCGELLGIADTRNVS
jgi:hypothetical protein